jgi:hypothetical protein
MPPWIAEIARREEADVAVTQTMRWMGRSAKNKAEAMTHSVKDRALEKRLERASDEADRLRFENDLLRDEVSQTRSEHGRILDLLEHRLSEPEEDEGKRSHKGRWLVFLMAVGGGAWAWMRMRTSGNGDSEWADARPAATETNATTM